MFMPYGLVPGFTLLWQRLRNRMRGKAANKAALASEASDQRGDPMLHAHGASDDARNRAEEPAP
jgi:hypothetical protein